jgi:hypothetical protein
MTGVLRLTFQCIDIYSHRCIIRHNNNGRYQIFVGCLHLELGPALAVRIFDIAEPRGEPAASPSGLTLKLHDLFYYYSNDPKSPTYLTNQEYRYHLASSYEHLAPSYKTGFSGNTATFMINDVLALCLLAIFILPSGALSGAVADPLVSQINWLPKFWPSTHFVDLQKRTTARSGINYNPNGSAFVWLQQDEYSGKTFFE